jgi:hypothetical protein
MSQHDQHHEGGHHEEHHHHETPEQKFERETTHRLEKIEHQNEEILDLLSPRLTRIRLQFTLSTVVGTRGIPMSAVQGPVTLTTLGQVATASILGFDQFGQPFTGTMPPASFSIDDTAGAVATSVDNDDSTDTVTAVANGVANLTATIEATDVNGNPITLTDTESITVALSGGGGTPVLSSIKIAFDTGTPATLAKKK